MVELKHRIKVFMYHLERQQPDYLLLKPDQGIEALWGPLHGSLGFGEKLEQAIKRRVIEATGVVNPGQVIDLEMNVLWTLGDEEVVEWTYGCHSILRPEPGRLSSQWADHRWADFEDAYSVLDLDHDRAAIMRLHTFLGAA